MTDATDANSNLSTASSTSSAEVEGYVHHHQQHQQQRQQQQQQQQQERPQQEQPQQQDGQAQQQDELEEQQQQQEQPQAQQEQQQQPYEQQVNLHPQPEPTTHQQNQQHQQQQPSHFFPSADQVSDVPFHHNAELSNKSVRWSLRDDILLCDALVAQHQRGRNRFNGVFVNEAWDEVTEVMKGSELVTGGAPKNLAHCKARWQRLKVEYRVVKHLRNEPGFSWDEAEQMITAPQETWDAYIPTHKDAQPWRKKKFPVFSRCAYLIEDELGRDKGDTKFKRRWEAAAASARAAAATAQSRFIEEDAVGEIDPALSSASNIAAMTGVFPLSSSDSKRGKHRTLVPATSAPAHSLPPHSISSAIQQYQTQQLNGNGKRAYPAEEEESISKRVHTAPMTYPPPPPPPHVVYSAPPAPVAVPPPVAPPPVAPVSIPVVPPAPGPVTAAVAPPTTTAPPAPAPAPPPPSSSSSSSRLTEAITDLESTYAKDGLSEHQFVKAIQLFQRRSDVLEAYVAIQSKRARVMYLKAELAEIGAGAGS